MSFFHDRAANPKGGRPVVLHRNEVIGILLFSSMVAPQRTLKGIYIWAHTFYCRRFKLPAYGSFVRKCHTALPDMLIVLDQLLVKDSELRFMDNTMLQVCKLIRADPSSFYEATELRWRGWSRRKLLVSKKQIAPRRQTQS